MEGEGVDASTDWVGVVDSVLGREVWVGVDFVVVLVVSAAVDVVRGVDWVVVGFVANLIGELLTSFLVELVVNLAVELAER